MINEKNFFESQKECADMLGMSLSEYQEYCNNLRVPTDNKKNKEEKENRTLEMLKILEINESKLKCRKDN